MWEEWLKVSLWGGVVALDTTAAMQILISHPLVSCSVVGLLLGNFQLGFLMGIFLELLWLNEFPIGGAPFSEGNLGATVAAALAILLTKEIDRPMVVIPLALMAGAAVASVGGHLVIFMRAINTHIYDALMARHQVNSALVSRSHHLCIALMWFAGASLTLVATVVLQYTLAYMIPFIPVRIDRWLQPISYGFLGIGCGVLIYIYYSRKNLWALVVGVTLGILTFLL